MDRCKFLQQIAVSAFWASASPLLGEVIGDANDRSGNSKRSPVGFPIPYWLQAELSRRVVHPPESAASRIFWVWLGVDTTPAAVTYDLERMKDKRIAGFILYGNQAGSIPRQIPKEILVEKDNYFEYASVKGTNYDDFHTTPIPLLHCIPRFCHPD